MVETLQLASPLPRMAPGGVGRLALLGGGAVVALLLSRKLLLCRAADRDGGGPTLRRRDQPGAHRARAALGKPPWIAVDHLQVSLTQFQAGDLSVYTIDNQAVRIGIGLSYRVPADAVFRLLYGVGRSGNVDIDANLRPIVADRALRVFARRNTVNISAEREAIANEVRRSVQEAVSGSFGIEIVDLQLSRIEYSPAFTQSVEAAVRAKNDALQAENTVARIRYEGEQAKVQAEAQAVAANTKAEGDARAAVTRARAEREATVLRAEGTAQATALTGQAEASAVHLMGAAVAANPRVVEFETARRWSGLLPTTMLGGGTVPMLSLPGMGADGGPGAATRGAAPGR